MGCIVKDCFLILGRDMTNTSCKRWIGVYPLTRMNKKDSSQRMFLGPGKLGEGVSGNHWTSSGRGNINICCLTSKMSSENL